jgi:hypothetical protein
MTLQTLITKYVNSAEHVLNNIKVLEKPVVLSTVEVSKVTDQARAYLEDAKYYREKRKFDVSLTSVAYCEGLLDALELLGAVKFEWDSRQRMERNEQ